MLKKNLLGEQGSDIWLLIMRVCVSAFMLSHGIPKLDRLMEGTFEFVDPFGIGPVASLVLTVFAEVVCSLLIIAGAWTRFSVIPAIVTMAVAAFIVHAQDPFKNKELALLYLLVYITLFIFGPGRYSVDGKFRRKNN